MKSDQGNVKFFLSESLCISIHKLKKVTVDIVKLIASHLWGCLGIFEKKDLFKFNDNIKGMSQGKFTS